MLGYFICATMFVGSVFASLKTAAPCHELPRPRLTVQESLANHPYITYYTNWEILQCTEIAFTPPQTGETGFNITSIITEGQSAVKFHNTIIDENIWESTLCESGFKDIYPTFHKNFNGTHTNFCVASCGLDLISYKYVICLGKSENDKMELRRVLDQYNIPGILDAQIGCDTKSKICSAIDKGVEFLKRISTPKIV